MIAFNPKYLTPDTIRALYAELPARYGLTVVHKSDSALMSGVGTFLSAIGVIDREAFLKRFTTIFGDTLYIPFDPGVEDENYDLWEQAVVLPHEITHKEDSDLDGWPIFAGKYAFSQHERALFEARGYRCNLEMAAWRGNGYVSPDAPRLLAARLQNYGCGAEAISAVEEALESARDDVLESNIAMPSVIATIQWFRSR